MDRKKFGQFIKEARQAKQMTQADVAEKLYLDVTAISKWERGVTLPDICMISDICKCLGITEYELLESTKDTEYRKAMYEAKQYRKSKRVVFWSFTSCFLIAILTCFIVDLCTSGSLTWFFIVLASCALGYWTFFYPVLFPIVKRQLNDTASSCLSKCSMLIYSAGLLLLTMATLFTTYCNYPYDILFAIKVTLYCFVILFAYGVIELFPIRRKIKLGLDSFLTGIYALGLGKVLPYLMHVEEVNYLDVDLLDWAGHTDGNVALMILIGFAVIGIVLCTVGICEKTGKKSNNG